MTVPTKELRDGIKIMNTIDHEKFYLIVYRIVQFLSDGTAPKPFTDDEECKLETSLEISRNQVKLLINTILEIYTQALYKFTSPAKIGKMLGTELGLDEKKTNILLSALTANAKEILANFNQTAYIPQLSHISYTISVETATELESKEKLPRAQLQLGVTNDKKQEDVNIEFTHDELYDFYQKLEKIQDQLDALK